MELKNFQPLHDQVVVEACAPVLTYKRLILPPNVARSTQEPIEGIVRAVGPGDKVQSSLDGRARYHIKSNEYRAPMHVQVGDRVLFWPTKTRDISTTVKQMAMDGKEYYVVHEEQHIEAVIG